MRRAATLSIAVLLLSSLSGACSTSSGSSSSSVGKPCAGDSDCAGGTRCGFANPDGGGAAECASPPLGVCVVPLDPASTDLCGCGGRPVSIVVDDVDAGVFYWSGVIVGERGFPPCADAAIAPSSADDAGDAATGDGAPGDATSSDGAPGDGAPGDAASSSG